MLNFSPFSSIYSAIQQLIMADRIGKLKGVKGGSEIYDCMPNLGGLHVIGHY